MQVPINTTMRAIILVKKRTLALFAGLSLSFGGLACQTTSPKKEDLTSRPELEKKLLESQMALVQNAVDSGHPEKAHALLRESLQKFPENPQLHNLMGLTQLALKNSKRALFHFEKSYQILPEIASGLNLSSALIDQGDYKRALIQLKTLIAEAKTKQYSYQERIYHNVGFTLLKLNKMRAAEKWFKMALEENPTFFPSHLELARIYLSQNRMAEANISLKRSHDYCLPCWEPIELLVGLYKTTHRYRDAHVLLVSYLKTPDLPEVSKNLGHKFLQEILSAEPTLSAKIPLPIRQSHSK